MSYDESGRRSQKITLRRKRKKGTISSGLFEFLNGFFKLYAGLFEYQS